MPSDLLEELFPGLQTATYEITSAQATNYNCIAWALHHATLYWDPQMVGVRGYYWPPQVKKDDSLRSWIDVFKLHGYKPCDDGALEPNYEKIALYGKSDGDATHVARQLSSGLWTSKLGKLEDISHDTLQALESGDESPQENYGIVVQFMRRLRQQEGSD